jgi:hypothetical protein
MSFYRFGFAKICFHYDQKGKEMLFPKCYLLVCYHKAKRCIEKLFNKKLANKEIRLYQQNSKTAALLFCFILALLCSNCVFQVRKKPSPDKITQTQNPINQENNDEGDFLVRYESAQKPEFAEYEKKLRDNKTLEKAVDKLNHSLSLPQDITIKIRECGEANSFYDSAKKQIILCFEMLNYFYELFRQEGYDEKESTKKAFDAMKFVFLHEISHALIDVYQLPITGNEEDAADRLSSIICLEKLGEEGFQSVLAAADAFKIEAKHKSFRSRSTKDEHLLQEQRAFTSLCMIYGADPDKYSYIAKKYLPSDRAQSCLVEYEKILRSWSSLLEKWQKD